MHLHDGSSPGILNDTVNLENSISLPYVFLSPQLAQQLQVSRYICIASLSALTWDGLISLRCDLEMWTHAKFGPPLITYFVSRVFVLAYVMGNIIFQSRVFLLGHFFCLNSSMGTLPVTPIHDCATIEIITACFYVIVVPATAALFYFRLWAIYSGNRVVQFSFGIMWLAVLACCCLVPSSTRGVRIKPTDWCIVDEFLIHASASALANTIYDTLVFLAITWNLVLGHHNKRERIQIFFGGKGLHGLARTILRSSQLYYFSTITVMITVNFYSLSHLESPVPHATLSMTNTVFTNAMACRVFREVWLDARGYDEINDVELKTLPWEVAPGPARVSTGVMSQFE